MGVGELDNRLNKLIMARASELLRFGKLLKSPLL